MNPRLKSHRLAFFLGLLPATGTLAQSDLIRVEHFIDEDPGFGNGVEVPISSGTDLELNFAVDLTDVPPGLHTLFVRAQDADGLWSLDFAKPIVVETVAITEADPDLTALEYFVDVNPGRGNATSLSLTSGPDVETTFTTDLSDVKDGLHTLFVRGRDARGHRSIPVARPMLVEGLTALDSDPTIEQIEYFLDANPGFSQGVGVTPASDEESETLFAVDLSAAANGLHTLFVRAKDFQGRWGMTFAKLVLVESVTPLDGDPSLQSGEYFIDTDPGFGQGTAFEIPSGSDSDIQFTADLPQPGSGLHTLFIRLQDARGSWGLPYPKLFLKETAVAGDPVSEVSAIQYYFVDPISGEATAPLSHASFSPAADVDLTFSLNLAGLSGEVTAFLSAVDQTGARGLAHLHSLTVELAAGLLGDLDGSGRVDFGDLFLFADLFSTLDLAIDFDVSGAVDMDDFLLFATNFGTGAS